ncbi:thermonuclease family protein [Ponticaulis profundi]|uniref:Thermonuclease family protein n=1 Tax=Ponticaulis profundi TaxID=2665222 RepID=A0ABW1SCB9_9PROT
MRGLSCIWAVCWLLVVSGCGASDRAGWLEGERGYVVRVMDGDTFALNTGQVVRMVSIEAPSFAYRSREEMPFAEEAKEALEHLVLGREVSLLYPGLTRDRYDRALAQVYVRQEQGGEIWVNQAMVRSGHAWVRLYPDTAGGSEELWADEEAARLEERGLWAGDSPIAAMGDVLEANRFVILQDVSARPTLSENICIARLKRRGINVQFPASENKCRNGEGSTMEYRGWFNGETLRLDSAENIRNVL